MASSASYEAEHGMEQQLQSLRADLARSQAEAKRLAAQSEGLQQEVGGARAEAQQLQEKCAELHQTLQASEFEMQAERAQFEEAIRAMEATRDIQVARAVAAAQEIAGGGAGAAAGVDGQQGVEAAEESERAKQQLQRLKAQLIQVGAAEQHCTGSCKCRACYATRPQATTSHAAVARASMTALHNICTIPKL
jgi:hypothetical protein